MPTLHILGAGTPTPTPTRFGTSYVLEEESRHLMIDCGPATTYKMVKLGLWPTRIDTVLFTHHHFDHNADYPCFLLCRWDQSIGKEDQLKVYGPPPTARLTEHLIGPDGAFANDWKARVGKPVSQRVHANRGGTLPRPEPDVAVTDVGPGPVAEESGWSVRAGRGRHVEPFLLSLAYRVELAGMSITFAGDTEPCDTVADLAAGTDVLVVNCWDHQETMNANGEAPGQTGTATAGRMARDAGAKTLILTHIGARLAAPGSREGGIADVANLYDGRIIFTEELTSLAL